MVFVRDNHSLVVVEVVEVEVVEVEGIVEMEFSKQGSNVISVEGHHGA